MVVLHSFGGGASDGMNPYGSLIQSGPNLYGMTYYGGSSNFGTVFQIGANGAGFNVLHSFAGGPNDGGNPQGSLIQSGAVLYGMTQFGATGPGATGPGTIFQIGTNGAGYNLLHVFTRSATDGGYPTGSLAQSASTFYGMTPDGGNASGSVGTVFQVGADGTGFSVLHSFSQGEGYYPAGSLVQVGSSLYGMAKWGGASDKGIIFRIGTNGTGYNIIHSFTGEDGSNPLGSLTASGSTLYGMTSGGGAAGGGTVFKMATDGTGFSTLHSFVPGPNDGFSPAGSLAMAGSSLFGMTRGGGATYVPGSPLAGGNPGDGTLFQILTDGTGYSVLHSFTGGPNDGAVPYGDLVLSGSTFYGMTSGGGGNGLGTIFSFTPVPEPSSLLLVAAGGSLALFARRRLTRRLRAARHAEAPAR
ncbi:MAG TPA: choice-of-anchor tandem repeat GloVer-containing protein [Gemmataceae bacterium]